MQELDRFIPAGGLPKPKRRPKGYDPTLADQEQRKVWCIYFGATLASATVLAGFVYRSRVTLRSVARLRRKFRVPKDAVTRLVDLPSSHHEAQRLLATRALKRSRRKSS